MFEGTPHIGHLEGFSDIVLPHIGQMYIMCSAFSCAMGLLSLFNDDIGAVSNMVEGHPQLGHLLSPSEIASPHSGHTIFGFSTTTGHPQLGHCNALLEIIFPQSGHLISAILITFTHFWPDECG